MVRGMFENTSQEEKLTDLFEEFEKVNFELTTGDTKFLNFV